MARPVHPLPKDGIGTREASGAEIKLSAQGSQPLVDRERCIDGEVGILAHYGLATVASVRVTLFYESTKAVVGDWDARAGDPAIDLKWMLSEPRTLAPSLTPRRVLSPGAGPAWADRGHIGRLVTVGCTASFALGKRE